MSTVSTILYVLAIICVFGYLGTKESGLMASGGLFMIGGAITMMGSKNKKSTKG